MHVGLSQHGTGASLAPADLAPWWDRSPLTPSQLSSVQTRYTQLRSLPAAHSNRKPLLEELQEDCSSLEYMVRS